MSQRSARTTPVESAGPSRRSLRSAPAQKAGGVWLEHDHAHGAVGDAGSGAVERGTEVANEP